MNRNSPQVAGQIVTCTPPVLLLPAAIGRAATLALYDELALSPKPGLVTLVDCGSHDDMDARTFVRSLLALRGYFTSIAGLGAAGEPFEALERCGIEAEARMMAATQGVNTHRGAIFTLGLLCASCGALAREGHHPSPARLRQTLLARWGQALEARALRQPALPGGIAAHRFGLRSASREAALGFPVLFETVLPAWEEAAARRLTPQQLKLDALFHAMAELDDGNLAHRGGLDGLRHAKYTSRRFLAAGGAARSDGLTAACEIGRDFVRRRLSPGGSADMLAAACLISRLGKLRLS